MLRKLVYAFDFSCIICADLCIRIAFSVLPVRIILYTSFHVAQRWYNRHGFWLLPIYPFPLRSGVAGVAASNILSSYTAASYQALMMSRLPRLFRFLNVRHRV